MILFLISRYKTSSTLRTISRYVPRSRPFSSPPSVPQINDKPNINNNTNTVENNDTPKQSLKSSNTTSSSYKSINKVEFIKSEVRISDIVEYYASSFRRHSEEESSCLCPFHDDTNPSLHIRDDWGYYHCFACGAHGNVFDYVRKTQNVSFPGAIAAILQIHENRDQSLSNTTYTLPKSSTINSHNTTKVKAATRAHTQTEPSLRPLPTLRSSRRMIEEARLALDPQIVLSILASSQEYFTAHLHSVSNTSHYHSNELINRLDLTLPKRIVHRI